MNSYLLNYRGHDYDALISRWKDIPLHQTEFSVEGGYSVFALENEAARSGREDGIYLSAGIHGDECAPVWALLEWAEEKSSCFFNGDIPFVIMPCLNPLGLIENQRRDHRGDDLNRMFQETEHSLIGAWKEFVEDRKFRLTVTLHEDYDAQGIYLYQLVNGGDPPGEGFLGNCEKIIPRDRGPKIDGSLFQDGLLTQSGDMGEIVDSELGGGYPEAVWLYQHHVSDGGSSQNFETPSEFSLAERVEAHRGFIESAVEMALKGFD